MIRPSDLPPHVRARLPQQPMARARRAVDMGADVKQDAAAGWFVCRTCGGEWTAWGGKSGAEEHSRTFRHPRVEWRWATDPDPGEAMLAVDEGAA